MSIKTIYKQSSLLSTCALGGLLLWCFFFSFTGCATAPEAVPAGLSHLQYFQRAQDAISDHNDYETALNYYRTFIQRYPDKAEMVVEAEYEIAYIYYRKGHYEAARDMFNNLLSYYEGEGAELLPPWPKVLAKKLLEKIEETQNK